MRILFVDDDPDTRALARRTVLNEFPQAEGAEATDRRTLTDALAAGRVDILVSDYDLRWMDGFQVFALTKEAHPDCVAVMFTGTGDEELAVRAMKAGFDDYVVKAPGQLKRLASSVRLAHERRAEHRLLRENREILRRELYHRLHNNLQLVVSLMSLTARAITDPVAKAQVGDLSRRIQSLSLLQEQFYRNEDLRSVDVGAFVRGLVDDLRESAPGAAIAAEVEPLAVPVDVAVPLGLIANEMMMSALSARPLPDDVTVSLRPEGVGARLTVSVRGVSAGVPAPGFATDLVTRLAAQIDADIVRETTSAGATTRVTLAL